MKLTVSAVGKEMQEEANSGYRSDGPFSFKKGQKVEKKGALAPAECSPKSADDLFSQVVLRQPDLGLARKITGMLFAMNEDAVQEAQGIPRILDEKIKEALWVYTTLDKDTAMLVS